MSLKSQINLSFLAIRIQVVITPVPKSFPGHTLNRKQDSLPAGKALDILEASSCSEVCRRGTGGLRVSGEETFDSIGCSVVSSSVTGTRVKSHIFFIEFFLTVVLVVSVLAGV